MSRHVTRATIDDAVGVIYTQDQAPAIVASYPPHEREARAKGIPTLGSGRIFPIEEDSILIDPIDIPPHWVQLGGLDFGWDHPTAGVKVAWDRDTDTIYITAAYKVREATPVVHAGALKPWGRSGDGEQWLPWAWPHDGLQHDKGSGVQLAEQYREQGLKLLQDRAQYEDGSFGVEAGIMDMLNRMQTGRFKVFNHLNDWIDEFRLYHRKDGKVVKEYDDLMSATRYAIMCLRFAVPSGNSWNAELKYDNRGIV